MTNHSSLEDHASDILHCHYGTLSQSLQYPIRVAELLCGERFISETTLSFVKKATFSVRRKGNNGSFTSCTSCYPYQLSQSDDLCWYTVKVY